VLQGPYVRGGGEKPPRPMRRTGSTVSCRMKLGAGGGAFSWRKSAGGKKDGHDHDASCSPAASSVASSSSSSSSSSMSYFFDVHSRGSGHWHQADGREDPEDGDVVDDGAKGGSVRITRFRRNTSLPNISTSHMWVSISAPIYTFPSFFFMPLSVSCIYNECCIHCGYYLLMLMRNLSTPSDPYSLI
jgi:hypothetical protein